MSSLASALNGRANLGSPTAARANSLKPEGKGLYSLAEIQALSNHVYIDMKI